MQLAETPISAGQFDDEHASDRALLQFLRFSVGADAYAVRIELVREILEVAQMTPLPLMPNFVRGVMNLRGAVVPVVDLAARMGMQSIEIGKRSCIIMVDLNLPDGLGHQSLGVLVDAVHEVFDVEDGGQEPVPRMGTKIDPAFIACIVRAHGQVVPALDFEHTLAQQALAQLISAHLGKGIGHAVVATV
ncbi:MAG: purine-binding chemotaxis protein CheW [Burkholderiales bacterium]|nr:purine-binding chemotaxis protein CheW [Burkholderiales bacterium]MDE2078062.1 purine-binding chemotaxis protein CheW [Burkholderiales bacterium]MDE2432480.1 purine-binding chemotaxis protein CheW [Burkholderiales bacterium]